jgi:hypothetical protein
MVVANTTEDAADASAQVAYLALGEDAGRLGANRDVTLQTMNEPDTAA